MARTHEVWGNAFAGEANTNELANFYRAIEKPLLAQCSPECVCGTGVLGDCPPADPDKHFGYDRWLDEMFDRHLEDQEGARENGLLNFGDWYDETKFGGGWGNQEYDTAHCFFKQYLRSGDRRYFDRARQGAGHMGEDKYLAAAEEQWKVLKKNWIRSVVGSSCWPMAIALCKAPLNVATDKIPTCSPSR